MGKKTPRRAERLFAFKVLYGLTFHPALSESDLLRAFNLSPDRPDGLDPENSYAWNLVFGVWKEMRELDDRIASYARNWRVERIGKVEVTILRIAFYELSRGRTDVPAKVAINEAVEISKQYSDEKSRIFVNGILDAAARNAVQTGAEA
ncbi:MAG: transcription antitermination factor NusB [Desulfovibrio sp.]|jgi:N utilization substance protein B|nr:transcription antitermination factor NusB [Desulfovibrio sp.]